MPARILLNITHGFQARMLLRTRITEELRAGGVELIVVAPNANEEYLRRELDQPGIELEMMPLRYPLLEKLAVDARAYLLMNPALGATLNYKRERYRRLHPWRYRITRAGNLLLGNLPPLRRAYQAAEAAVFAGREFDALLARTKPDLVVAGTPGVAAADAHLLRAAKRAKIRSATVMLSWDNLTSKGYMAAQPDVLLVWNQLMRREALDYHDFTGPIIEVGAAQFDVYREIIGTPELAGFRAAHGIASRAPLIVWGTINNEIYPNQLEVLQQFVARIEQDPRRPHLWVRIHPQTVFGRFEHLEPAYRQLASERVTVEFPPVRSESLRWDLPKRDMVHLACLMTQADVVITPRSTLTIDAACAQTPVINLAIDREFAVGFDYTHYRNVVKHDGVWIVGSMAELQQAVDTYLREPGLHREGREAIVAEQQGRYFGSAGVRTAAVLARLAAGEPAAGLIQGPEVDSDVYGIGLETA